MNAFGSIGLLTLRAQSKSVYIQYEKSEPIWNYLICKCDWGYTCDYCMKFYNK